MGRLRTFWTTPVVDTSPPGRVPTVCSTESLPGRDVHGAGPSSCLPQGSTEGLLHRRVSVPTPPWNHGYHRSWGPPLPEGLPSSYVSGTALGCTRSLPKDSPRTAGGMGRVCLGGSGHPTHGTPLALSRPGREPPRTPPRG